ncbi:MAG: cupin domain-containing protein [Myxococcales bacterium]|nr:cupin domain-containing protein [Myxococcales bacterium]
MKAHWLDGQSEIGATELREQGVHYELHPTQESAYRADVDRLKEARGYVQEDVVELTPQTPNLDAICAKFVDEHSHDDDEVRFVLEGDGIFDIRSNQDAWMRVVVEPGDLIVVPAKRHHRFMLTDRKAIRCVRLFRDEGGWVPHYR